MYSTDEFRGWLVAHQAFPGPNILVAGLTLIGEIRGGDLDAKAAVAHTFKNRADKKKLSVTDVCLQRLQYSCWTPVGGVGNYDYLMGVVEAITTAIDDKIVDFSQYPLVNECIFIARGVLMGYLPDTTKGSTHYYVKGSPEPAWAVGKTPAAEIGPHLFFNDIPW